jgi:transaldolase
MVKNQRQDFSKFNRTLFLDSSKIEEIKKWNATGVIDGVTTNQMIMLKDGIKPKEYSKVIKDICLEMKGKPVSIELTDSTASPEEMVKEAKRLNALAPNIVVKVPLIPDTIKSLWVINQLAKANIAVNVTTMMTFEQMVMAILATRNCKRLSFVSIFWGRSVEDHDQYRSKSDFEKQYPKVGPESAINADVKILVQKTAEFLKEGNYENPKIIIGSLRNASQVGVAFAAGGHIPTVPPATLEAMLFSKRSIETIQQFDDAWKEMQKKK